MKVATYLLTADTPGAPLDLPPEVFWARFGDEPKQIFGLFTEVRESATTPARFIGDSSLVPIMAAST
jgi:hypothetical protein